MRSVYISPQFTGPDKGDGGIRRVIEAMRRYLPDYGWRVTDDITEADLVNCHGAALVDYPPTVPMVASCHGLYWSDYKWSEEYYSVNQQVIETLRRAQHITAPSEWVAHALRHGVLTPVTPIYHGVNVDDWKAGNDGGYVLWNKARPDPVSNPADFDRLVTLMPDVNFVSTIGQQQKNVRITGRVSYQSMKALVENCSVYLATARETFGIGTLEALAAGKLVVGWRFGGQEEIIIEGETGFLVEYGDYEGLATAVRKALELASHNTATCRQDAERRWGWPQRIAEYARVFDEVYDEWHKRCPSVSIIVTCHNLGKYLDDCLASVTRLTFTGWECVIVDDDSRDNTAAVAQTWVRADDRFKYIKPDRNLGLSGARNFGVKHSSGRYILPLDADDMLTSDGLTALVELLNEDQSVHIAYGNLRIINDDATQQREEISSPGDQFNWLGQMAHINQLFYCSLMRREVLINSGGYRVRDWRAEDAAFWCRVTSLGYRAKKATEKAVIYYRIRSDSKSAHERERYHDNDGDWTAWFGWRIAGNYEDGRKAIARHISPNPYSVPFGAQAPPPSDVKTWSAGHRQNPLVSVIIPVGPGHAKYLVDTLDSLLAQTYTDYEAVVVNDTGHAIDLTPWPWARLIETAGGRGAGAARNAGLQAARGELVYFLDADDWLLSNCLQMTVNAWIAHDGQHYVYTNYQAVDQNGRVKHEKLKPFQAKNWRGQHAINMLMTRADALKIGGFDETMTGWEDWDFQIKCQINGICGVFIPVETFVYRFHSGQRRQTAADNMPDLLPILQERYRDYFTGAKEIMSCGCGNTAGAKTLLKAKASMAIFNKTTPQLNGNRNGNGRTASTMTRLEFIGTTTGTRTFIRVATQKLSRTYRGGNNMANKYIDAAPEDVELLLQSGLWRAVERPQEAAPDTDAANVPAPKPVNYDEPQAVEAETEPAPETSQIDITPQAKQEAEAAGLDLSKITGTGADGKITVADVRAAIRELA